MRSEIVLLLVVLSVVAAADKKPEKIDPKSFLRTWTLIVGSATTTSTSTLTTTCTTSTTTLSTCTNGRRRRGLFYDDGEAVGKYRRGLFYNDEEVESNDGNVVKRSAKDELKPINKETSKATEQIVPFQIQSGFKVPEGVDKDSRFAFSFATTTLTVVTTTTSTSSLTATCASTTGFPTCGSGK